MTRDECLSMAFVMNDAAGQLILRGRYDEAASLLARAAIWSPSELGRKALYARASEAAAMTRERES